MENNKPYDSEETQETCNCEDECCQQADEMNPDMEDQSCSCEGCMCDVYVDEDV